MRRIIRYIRRRPTQCVMWAMPLVAGVAFRIQNWMLLEVAAQNGHEQPQLGLRYSQSFNFACVIMAWSLLMLWGSLFRDFDSDLSGDVK